MPNIEKITKVLNEHKSGNLPSLGDLMDCLPEDYYLKSTSDNFYGRKHYSVEFVKTISFERTAQDAIIKALKKLVKIKK